MDPNIFTLSVLELLFDLKFHQKEREKEREDDETHTFELFIFERDRFRAARKRETRI